VVEEKSRTFGHISFRLKEEAHRELLEIARHLEMDMSGLINAMVAEARPIFLRRAADLARRRVEARKFLDEVAIPLPPADPVLVARAMDAGRAVEVPVSDPDDLKRYRAMVAAVAGKEKNLTVPQLQALTVALSELQREDERRQLEKAVDWWNASAAGDPEGEE
jgi:hypothetical protein